MEKTSFSSCQLRYKKESSSTFFTFLAITLVTHNLFNLPSDQVNSQPSNFQSWPYSSPLPSSSSPLYPLLWLPRPSSRPATTLAPSTAWSRAQYGVWLTSTTLARAALRQLFTTRGRAMSVALLQATRPRNSARVLVSTLAATPTTADLAAMLARLHVQTACAMRLDLRVFLWRARAIRMLVFRAVTNPEAIILSRAITLQDSTFACLEERKALIEVSERGFTKVA